METKTCTKCKEIKSATLEYFSKHKKTKDNLNSWCKSCANISTKNSKIYNTLYAKEVSYEWKYKFKGVYAIYEKGVCLYVGSSKRILDRWSQHISCINNPSKAPKSNQQLAKQLINHKHIIFGIIEVCNDYLEKEKQYINQLKPKYNLYGL
jgi:hypothetical protein